VLNTGKEVFTMMAKCNYCEGQVLRQPVLSGYSTTIVLSCLQCGREPIRIIEPAKPV